MGALAVSCIIVWVFFIVWGASTKDPVKKDEIKEIENDLGWGGFRRKK